MPALSHEDYAKIIDNIPHVIMRLSYEMPDWNVRFVNRAVERYGYTQEEFITGKMNWNKFLHPDDRVFALKQTHDYMENGIHDFKLHYRLRSKNGASIYITEYSHVNRHPGTSQVSIDSFLLENLEARANDSPGMDAAVSRSLALNDILLTLQDANADPEKTIQFILDRTGALLDCSRALLFKDSPDHKTCKVVYEWLNQGITSIKDLDYAVTYATEMPEIYVALQDTGILLVNAGEIPENCREEFDAEGLVASAIFAVYLYGDHYGFVCFDDCVIKRHWDAETADFLKVIANLLSTAVMNHQGEEYMRSYEEKIKSLAFRDYPTGLPNHYPYDSDIADAILAAESAQSPGYAVMITLNNTTFIRNTAGLKMVNTVICMVAEELRKLCQELLKERGTLYRLSGTVFGLLVLPGECAPVRVFAERAAAVGSAPWKAGTADFACSCNVAVIPFGIKNVDPEIIGDRLDAAMIESYASPTIRLVFQTEEK